MSEIKKNIPPVVGEYAYYETPTNERMAYSYKELDILHSDNTRWFVTVNKDGSEDNVLCCWSSSVVAAPRRFVTYHGIIISVDSCLY